MKGTVSVGAEASVQRNCTKRNICRVAILGHNNGKSSRLNYWHGLCSTNCGQTLLAGISVGTKIQATIKKAVNFFDVQE